MLHEVSLIFLVTRQLLPELLYPAGEDLANL